ncbi:MAG: hypothetical protein AAGM67_14630 [Bacteroidota bacterium]
MNQIIRYILAFLVYLVLQLGLFNHLGLWDVAMPFVFLLFLFTLPFDWPVPVVLGVAFATGLTMDVLSSSTANGLHAFACVFAVGTRERIAALASGSNIRSINEMSLRDQSSFWFVIYLFSLILLHNLAYFFLEVLSFDGFLRTLLKIGASTIYTFLLCFALGFIFYKR